MNPEKDPPTHTIWSQRREHGKFREWYKRGHAWIEKDAQGQINFCAFEGVPGPRGYDGFFYGYPVGVEPPPPPKSNMQAQRPGNPLAVDDEDV